MNRDKYKSTNFHCYRTAESLYTGGSGEAISLSMGVSKCNVREEGGKIFTGGGEYLSRDGGGESLSSRERPEVGPFIDRMQLKLEHYHSLVYEINCYFLQNINKKHIYLFLLTLFRVR